MELPRWKSHKIVRAAKIIGAIHNGGEQTEGQLVSHLRYCVLKLDGGTELIIDPDVLFARGYASIGDYFVWYDDGYSSWSPADAFEKGYTRLVDGDPKASDFTPISEAMLDAGAKAVTQFVHDLPLTSTAYDLACAVLKAAMEAQMEADKEMPEYVPPETAFRGAMMHGLPAITVGKGDDSEPRQTWVRAERYEAMVEALDWYGRGAGTADTLEQVARGDVDLARATEEFAEDCGDKARAVLDTL